MCKVIVIVQHYTHYNLKMVSFIMRWKIIWLLFLSNIALIIILTFEAGNIESLKLNQLICHACFARSSLFNSYLSTPSNVLLNNIAIKSYTQWKSKYVVSLSKK